MARPEKRERMSKNTHTKANCFASSNKKRSGNRPPSSSHNHKFKLMQISLLLYQLCVFVILFFYVYRHCNGISLSFSPFSFILLSQNPAIVLHTVKTIFHFHLSVNQKSGEWTVRVSFSVVSIRRIPTGRVTSENNNRIGQQSSFPSSFHFVLLFIHLLWLHLIK